MPRRDDIQTILLIGSGPIVIGQACEFDYSGTQACRALTEEGYRVVLINSNPATIMTDPETADEIYLEPLTVEACRAVIEQERPDALLPTLGGQTALNLARELALGGALEEYGVELIGADLEAIERAEDRERFHGLMMDHGMAVPRGGFARDWEEARRIQAITGFPVIVRPAYTLGGTGGGVAKTSEEFEALARGGMAASPIGEILVEESVIGWKEFELEVMRDRADNCVVVCSIENLDPMGVHTGDSITVAPQQTLSDREYQEMRDDAFTVIRAVGVETGGSNIQFAVEPATGRQLVIEKNPRVSRSSALAPKATGFPIAKIAARLAVGYTLDEIPNDITGETPASFEPTIDYVVAKFPRFDFEKFPGADEALTTSMKSVGETMAIGRTFGEAIQKGLRGLEAGAAGLLDEAARELPEDELADGLEEPSPGRVHLVAEAIRREWPVERVRVATGIDPWFLHRIGEVVRRADGVAERAPEDLSPLEWSELKGEGYSDFQLGRMWGRPEQAVRELRRASGVTPAFKVVDTCAGEFEAQTPYFYSSYDPENEAGPLGGSKIVILGGGPNRIGQGIEFDYCCVQAAIALRESGRRVVMVNCNPETVSTDYDVSDRLYFEPLTLEDVSAILAREDPDGVLVQYGGQTPLELVDALHAAGVPIVGTSPDAIDACEDRDRFQRLMEELGIPQPRPGTARSPEEAREEAERIGYPVLLRPSYVLGGRGMVVVRSPEALERYLAESMRVTGEKPLLIDEFLEGAVEYDVDAIADGERVVIGGIMQHVEAAGIHSGDSTCVLPPIDIDPEVEETIRNHTRRIGRALEVRGLMNIQYAVRDGRVHVLEVNPRASRTVPFVSKAVGVPLAKLGARAMVGESLDELGLEADLVPMTVAVKAPVLPFDRFPGVDPVLGPEMHSTGEVIGLDADPEVALRKALLGAGIDLRAAIRGGVLFDFAGRDADALADVAAGMAERGIALAATPEAAEALTERGVAVERVSPDGERGAVRRVREGEFGLVVSVPREDGAGSPVRRAALVARVPCLTEPRNTARAAAAAEAGGVALPVRSLHSWTAAVRS
ncbi:MAG: carbamoyl-phosphate synthase large subunit [Gemmatimonadota bacterium]|nr:carbamoyl-phosphate synthase large subunit [Gemmatimonadota bacterium]